MLRQKFSYRTNIEPCKKPKTKEKIELKSYIQQKQEKAKFPAGDTDA